MNDEYDVIVVGGGPSGCVVAVLLARRGYRVCLADAGVQRTRLADVLAPDVVRLLRSLIPFCDPAQNLVRPCRGVLSQWGRAEPQLTDYELLTVGPAWIVARPAFDRVLLDAVSTEVPVVRLGWTAVSSERLHARHRVVFSAAGVPVTATARALVYATGRATSFRATPRTYEDSQVAIAFPVTGAELHGLLWVESADSSWWYLNDAPGGAQLVWVTAYEPVLRGAAGRAERMQSRLRELGMIRSALPPDVQIAHTHMYDARLSRIAGSLPDGCFCPGDAVETSDPLSGRGWYRAITSAMATAAQIDRTLGGDSLVLPRFSVRQTYADHVEERAQQWRAAYNI